MEASVPGIKGELKGFGLERSLARAEEPPAVTLQTAGSPARASSEQHIQTSSASATQTAAFQAPKIAPPWELFIRLNSNARF